MYVYNDEDNAPMNDDPFEEKEWISRENHLKQMERDRAEQKDAKIERRKGWVEGLADMLELTGDCRKCYHFTELAEGFLDQNGQIANEQLDFLKMQCSVCGGMGTGKPKDEKHEKWLEKHWDDLMEWVKLSGLNFRCCWCPNVYRVYGQYKDPDDEWKAIECLCCNCKYFGED